MAFTLFDLVLRASESLGKINESVATGGSATTVVDSLQTATRSRFTDDVLDGIIFITHDAGNASAAPEGQFGRITAFDSSSGTYTHPTLTAEVAAGDAYAWTGAEYSLQRMIGLANEALQRIGDIPLADITTLTTVDGDTEYACSVAWKRRPFEISIQGDTDDSSDNRWIKMEKWEYVPAAAGTAGKIIFPIYPSSGKAIRIKYMDRHPYVYAYSSVINEHIEPELATLSLVAKALSWKCKRTNGADSFTVQAWNQAEQEFLARKAEHPAPSFYRPRKGNLMIVNDSY